MKQAPNATPRVLLNVADVVAATSLSRSIIYIKIRSGELATVKVGKRRLISSSALQEWIREGVGVRRMCFAAPVKEVLSECAQRLTGILEALKTGQIVVIPTAPPALAVAPTEGSVA
jgi:excisionase family DNA binding protein